MKVVLLLYYHLYKIKNANSTIPNYIVIPLNDQHWHDYFTAPSGVNVIFAIFDWNTDQVKSAEEYLKESLKANDGEYIKVTPNKTYGVYNTHRISIESVHNYELSYSVGNFHKQVKGGDGVSTDPDYYYIEYCSVIIAWSNEINQRTTTNSAD